MYYCEVCTEEEEKTEFHGATFVISEFEMEAVEFEGHRHRH